MSQKHIQGLINATLVYSVIGGAGVAILWTLAKAAMKDQDALRFVPLLLAVMFVVGLAIWLWLVRGLQRAF
ncbi:MAG: hypothetical protein GEEBNDBF_00784 [bacterium]|nr:hypothetical protein [bacterium]